MTRNEAKNLIIRNNAEWVWYETINKIFDEFGEQLQDKDKEIQLWKAEFRRMQDIAINKDVALEKALEEIKELKDEQC